MKLQCGKIRIDAAERNERRMRARLDDLAVFHDDDAVGALHGRQAVRDDDGCLLYTSDAADE